MPAEAIERVEVVRGPVSTLYGSDAIGGVVNIITRSGQKGFRAQAQYGQYLGEGDGETQNYQLSWGGGSERGAMPRVRRLHRRGDHHGIEPDHRSDPAPGTARGPEAARPDRRWRSGPERPTRTGRPRRDRPVDLSR